jgi:hypothetical protein
LSGATTAPEAARIDIDKGKTTRKIDERNLRAGRSAASAARETWCGGVAPALRMHCREDAALEFNALTRRIYISKLEVSIAIDAASCQLSRRCQ